MTRDAAESTPRVAATIAFAAAVITALAAFASYLSAGAASGSQHLHASVALLIAILALCAVLRPRLPRRLISVLALFALAMTIITIIDWVFDASSVLEHLFFDPLPWTLDRFPTRAMIVTAIALGFAALGTALLAKQATAEINALIWSAGMALLLAAIYLVSAESMGIAGLTESGPAFRADVLLYLAIIADGLGLLAHTRTIANIRSTRWVQLRLLFLLVLGGGSVLLWHGLRSIEWRNLQTELQDVQARDINVASHSDLQRTNTFLQLTARWRGSGWKPDAAAMRDEVVRTLFRYDTYFAVAVFDERGKLVGAVARKDDLAADAAEPAGAEIIDQQELERRYDWSSRFGSAVTKTINSRHTQAVAAQSQDAGRPHVSLVCVSIAALDSTHGGAIALILNLDTLVADMFGHATPGYTTQISTQSLIYQEGEPSAKPPTLARISPAITPFVLGRLSWKVESWPDAKTLNRLLTPLPGFVLACGWLVSTLLFIAWRAEYRAHRLLADRQVILDSSLSNQRRMTEAQRIAHVGSWSYDPAADRFECSEECLRILGVDKANVVQTQADARGHLYPADAPVLSAAFAALRNGGKPVDFAHRLRRSDGAVVYVHTRASFVAADTQLPAHFFGTLQDITEHRELEDALRSSEARYRSIAAQVGAIHLEWDLLSDKVRMDGALEEVLGYQPEKLARMSFHEVSLLVHPDDAMQMRATLKLARESTSDWHGEYRVRHNDGHYVHLNSRGLFLTGPAGKAERMVMAAADITERKNVELRLRDSEERLRIATEQSGRAVYDLNTSTNAVRWAGATQLLFGFSIAEMERMTWDECLSHLHPRDLQALNEINARGEDHTVNHREFRVRQRNGSYIHAESISAAQIDEHGRPYRTIGVLSDITARRTAEIERQQYTKQLRTLAEVARNITIFLTVDELVGHLAGAMRGIIGAHQSAISIVASQRSGKALHCVSLAQKYGDHPDAVPLSDDNLILELLGEHGSTVRLSREQLQAHLLIARIEHYATGKVPLEGLLAARMLARDGSPIGLLRLSAKKRGDFTDSDVQILAQLAGLAAVAVENARLLETLEERVTQRTQDLEVSNRELEAFSYSVSHDLRAPLRAIAGFSQILNDQYAGQLDAQGLRCLERISGGVQKMAELIDDLLGLARVSRAEITRQRLNLSALAATIVNRHCERAPERSVEILIDADMTVQADPRLLEVVLDNLIENAFKFTSKREDASIHIGSMQSDGSAAAERHYFIADNGVGFDPEYANNLFGVFQRLHSVNDFPGTGVGLAIVQRILHRHGGRIWARSQLDAGATFNFTLGPG